MNKETYTVENVSRHLNSLPGISVQGATIKISPNTQIGTKTWGKIDFLRNNKFSIVYLATVEVNKKSKEDIEANRPIRKSKRKSTIDAVSSVKKVMKGINVKSKK